MARNTPPPEDVINGAYDLHGVAQMLLRLPCDRVAASADPHGLVRQWKNRGKLPPADWTVNGLPYYSPGTIEEWHLAGGCEPQPAGRPKKRAAR